MASFKLKGAIAIGGRVFRAGQETALAKAAASAGVDLSGPRFSAQFEGTPEALPPTAGKPKTTATRTPAKSANLKTDEDVRAAFSTRDAARYLAAITDKAEVKRLAAIDGRVSLAKIYQARLEELG